MSVVFVNIYCCCFSCRFSCKFMIKFPLDELRAVVFLTCEIFHKNAPCFLDNGSYGYCGFHARCLEPLICTHKLRRYTHTLTKLSVECKKFKLSPIRRLILISSTKRALRGFSALFLRPKKKENSSLVWARDHQGCKYLTEDLTIEKFISDRLHFDLQTRNFHNQDELVLWSSVRWTMQNSYFLSTITMGGFVSPLFVQRSLHVSMQNNRFVNVQFLFLSPLLSRFMFFCPFLVSNVKYQYLHFLTNFRIIRARAFSF